MENQPNNAEGTVTPEASLEQTPQNQQDGQLDAAEGAEATSAPKSSKEAAKSPSQALKKKLKLTVDGEEFEEEIDFNDDERLKRELQLAKLAPKRAKETAELRKEKEQIVNFMEELAKSPKKLREFIKTLGYEEEKLVQEIVEEHLANSQKSPEQRRLEEMENQLKAANEEKEKIKKDSEERQRQALEEKYHQEFDTQITKALESKKIPKSDIAVKKIAYYMEECAKLGFDVSVNDIVPIVSEEIYTELRDHLNALGDDDLEQFMGKDIYNRMRKRNVAKAKDKPPVPLAKSLTDVGSEKKETEQKQIAKKTIRQLWGI